MAATAGISRATIERLAEGDAFRSLGLDRRAALWAARRLDTLGIRKPGVLRPTPSRQQLLPLLTPHMSDDLFPEPEIALPHMALCEHVAEDYTVTGLSLKAHPISFFRDRLTALGALPNMEHRRENARLPKRITVAGLVLVRQRPGTAKGTVFLTLEDETDVANIIVWPKIFAQHRRIVMNAQFLAVRGILQRAGLVVHVVAESFVNLSTDLRRLRNLDLPSAGLPLQAPANDLQLLKSRDFH
jgi:error-prone DNA polymerase